MRGRRSGLFENMYEVDTLQNDMAQRKADDIGRLVAPENLIVAAIAGCKHDRNAEHCKLFHARRSSVKRRFRCLGRLTLRNRARYELVARSRRRRRIVYPSRPHSTHQRKELSQAETIELVIRLKDRR